MPERVRRKGERGEGRGLDSLQPQSDKGETKQTPGYRKGLTGITKTMHMDEIRLGGTAHAQGRLRNTG